MKEDVEKAIPPKEEVVVELEMADVQKQYYRAILERNRGFLNRYDAWCAVCAVCAVWFVVCVCGLWFVVCEVCVVCVVWCVVCGVWCVVCGVWCVVCGVWCVVCGVWCVVCGLWWGMLWDKCNVWCVMTGVGGLYISIHQS